MRISHIIHLLILSSLPLVVQAEDNDTTHVLNEIIVRDARRAVTIPSQTLDGARLNALSSHSVADALRHFAGVQIKDYGGIGGVKTINIRSMGSHHTGVYYDGIRLGNAQNGQIDLGRYDLTNIEEISLYNGNKSNIFQGAGDFGNAGAVYLRTRRPRWHNGERYHLDATVRGGSFGLINPSVTADWRLNSALSLSASASYTTANGRYRFRYRRLNHDGSVAYDTTATRHGGDIDAVRAEMAMHGVGMRGTWMAKAYFYDSDRGIPGAIVNNVFRNSERQHDRSIMLQGRTEQVLSQRYSLMVSAKFANDYLHYLRDDPREIYIDNRYRQNEAYISSAHLFKINTNLSADASLDLQYNTMTADMAQFKRPQRFTAMGAGALAWASSWLSAQASCLVTSVSDFTHGEDTKHRLMLSPAAFFNITAGKSHIYGFAKQSWRMPTFNDLYYVEIGNRNLRPERTLQLSLGTDRDFHCGPVALTGRLEMYHNRVSDKIIAYPAGQQFRWTMLNLGFVSIFGVEATVDATAKVREVSLTGHLSYTWQSARDRTDPDDSFYNNQIPYIPHHAFSASLGSEWRGWQLNYATIYTGRRWSAQENIRSNLEPPWYTHDLSVFYNFSLRSSRLRLGLEVNNLFNQDYEVIRNYPMPGRSFRAIARIQI